MTAPLTFVWEGDAFRPVGRAQAACDEQYTIGQRYVLAEVEPRSMASHNHYFAAVNEAWQTLPDAEIERYPSPDHLRKAALVRTGFAKATTVVCKDAKEARKVTVDLRRTDTFAIVDLSDNVVTMWIADSQSIKAMGKAEFQRSKEAVLDWIGKTYDFAPAELGSA